MTPTLRVTRRAGIAALCVVLAAGCGGPERHRDGEGPLAVLNDPTGFARMVVARTPGVDTWSFGSMLLCLRLSGTSAVIRAVGPHDSVGSGFQPAGVVIHDFTWSSGAEATISSEEFPPATAVRTVAPEGYVVDVECSSPPPDQAAELIVGLTATSDDGGGWLGADVTYSVDGQDYVLEINNEMLICGTSTAKHCEGAPSPPVP